MGNVLKLATELPRGIRDDSGGDTMDISIREVINSMSEEEKDVMYGLVGIFLEIRSSGMKKKRGMSDAIRNI